MEQEKIKKDTLVVATYGFNNVLNEPFKFLYKFGYYTEYGCIVYNNNGCSMQDASSFKLNQIQVATEEDLQNLFWGD